MLIDLQNEFYLAFNPGDITVEYCVFTSTRIGDLDFEMKLYDMIDTSCRAKILYRDTKVSSKEQDYSIDYMYICKIS